MMAVFLVLGCVGVYWWAGVRINFPVSINSRENPTFVLARQYWGGAWVIVLLALLNS